MPPVSVNKENFLALIRNIQFYSIYASRTEYKALITNIIRVSLRVLTKSPLSAEDRMHLDELYEFVKKHKNHPPRPITVNDDRNSVSI